MAVIEEVSAKWLAGLYNHLCSSAEIIWNSFLKAGIVNAIESLEGHIPSLPLQNDPFANLDD